MAQRKILLLDPSSLRQQFLSEMLAGAGEVAQFDSVGKAVQAVERGQAVDVAVLEYRLAATPLIRAVRQANARARIIAFGMPRPETPMGVDVYLHHPVLSAELRRAVEGAPKGKRAKPAAV